MDILYFLVPAALVMGGLFLAGFVWAVKTGQYEDLETPAFRILFDEKNNEKLNNLKMNNQKMKEELEK